MDLVWVGATIFVAFSIFVMFVTAIPLPGARRLLALVAGEKRAGTVGPTEMGAAFMRQHNARVIHNLSEPLRSQYRVPFDFASPVDCVI